MNLRDAALAFGVSEPTLLRWIEKENLPAFLINGRYRFNRVDLLEWSSLRKRPMRPGEGSGAAGGRPFEVLREALRAGGVHRAVSGADPRSALAEAAERLPLPAAERALAAQALADRESGGSTAVGDGIAIPHPRSPLVFPVDHPVVTLCYLERPVDFGAADGLPARVLFLLLAPTVRSHLELLAELASALHDGRFKAAVSRGAGLEEILGILAGTA